MARVICVYSWYRIYNNNVKTAEGFGTSAIAMTYNLAEWKGAFDTVSTEKSPFLNMGCTCFSWETEDGMQQTVKICYRFGGYIGEQIVKTKMIRKPRKKKDCPRKTGMAK